ncbi:Flp pilus assembly complex ATPase component TadA [Nocardiopsis dassonvillei]|uniref:CpaF family protein n=1 Tax=Nocardiopsis dassonvillei TaxID=2014 RepID=UPI00200DE7E4|nr:ATPase, T2SS/T4P/T4SS family [Nocardiopsis dassonvillei]MCK9871416.1 Flp pilus assembly complex ATPase component TadA [Nocardiopsis dassonvillei]
MYEVMGFGPQEALDWSLVRTLRETVVDRLSKADVAEAHKRERGRDLTRQVVSEWMHEQVTNGHRPSSEYALRLQNAIFAAVFELGRLQPLLRPDVENIEIHGHDITWLQLTDGTRQRGPAVAESDDELVQELQFLASRQGRSLSTSNPRLHMELPDGSRLAAVIATTRRPHVVIRRHLLQHADLNELVRRRMLTPAAAQFLEAAVLTRHNIVVCGGQGSGKTTLVRSLADLIPATDRWATAEQEYELHLDKLMQGPGVVRHPHLVAFQARQGGSELGVDGRSAGEVTLEEIVRDALRMNLTRIMVGEVRGPEVVPMLDAMSTGDGGSMCTLHARSARDAVERLVVLCGRSQATLTPDISYRWIAGSVDLIVHVDMRQEFTAHGTRTVRVVDQITEVVGVGEGGLPSMNDLFRSTETTVEAAATGLMPKRADDLRRAGWRPSTEGLSPALEVHP